MSTRKRKLGEIAEVDERGKPFSRPVTTDAPNPILENLSLGLVGGAGGPGLLMQVLDRKQRADEMALSMAQDAATARGRANLERFKAEEAIRLELLKEAHRSQEEDEKRRFQEGENRKKRLGTLAAKGLQEDELGNISSIPKEQLPEQVRNRIELDDALTELTRARTEVAKASTDPNSPSYKLKLAQLHATMARVAIAQENIGLQREKLGLQREKFDFSVFGPTSTSKTAAQTAEVLLGGMSDIRNRVDDLSSELGPVMGRVNNALRGIGDPDPRIQRLATDLGLLSSGLSKFHGARGVQAIKLFSEYVNSGKLSASALQGSLDAIESILQRYKKEGAYKPRTLGEGKTKRWVEVRPKEFELR